ncbi:hypothetical protein H5T87_07360 [bacterium]|nr:hypothetical protein [bacterium]
MNPKVVPADGTSTAVITAQIREEGKGLVTQSLRVDFATTLGTITPWVNTEGGVARAEITSTKQGTAVITVSCMGSTVQTNVTFVSEQEFANKRQSRCIRVTGDYLAWCADGGVLDATGNVMVNYGMLLFEGDSFQIEARLSFLRALGKIKVSNGKKVIEGDRLFWDFTANRGWMLIAREEVKAIEIEGVGLVEGTSRGYIPSYAFEFYDPSESRIIILAKEANIFPGEKVYLRGTTTFVGGSKVFSLPYQLISFSAYGDYTQQMLNWGTSGIALDFPFYFALKENYVGALRLRYATGSGIEVYTRRRGWNLALDQQYELPQARGGILLEQGEGNDWGITWSHNHFLGKNLTTNLYLNYLAEGDRYNRASLRKDWKTASFIYNFYQREYRDYQSEGQDASLRLRPLRIGQSSLTIVSRLYKWNVLGKELFLQWLSPPFRFGKSHIDFSLETGYQWAMEDKGLYTFNIYSGRELGNWGNLSLSYSKFNGTRYGSQGGENLGLNFSFRKEKWNGYLYVNNGLEDNSHFSYGNLSYYLNPDWGFHLRYYFYKLGLYKFTDRQYIISRTIGNREAYLYWSERDKKIGFEISQGGF